MSNLYDFSTDRINIFSLVIDCSSSMSSSTEDMKRGLRLYKKSFENFPEADSIAVSVNRFNGEYYKSSFRRVSEFEINYETDGFTALCYSICEGTEQLINYINEVARRTGCVPRATFIVFSDGQPCGDSRDEEDAKRAIEKLNLAGITTVFVAFGGGISSEFGRKIGFLSTIDVDDRSVLEDFLGVELSKSCKEQSQSLRSLGSDFFSKANKSSKSEKYSQKTQQAIENENWFDDI